MLCISLENLLGSFVYFKAKESGGSRLEAAKHYVPGRLVDASV